MAWNKLIYPINNVSVALEVMLKYECKELNPPVPYEFIVFQIAACHGKGLVNSALNVKTSMIYYTQVRMQRHVFFFSSYARYKFPGSYLVLQK